MNCVQCGLKYEDEEAADCSFHSGTRDGRSWNCCGQQQPCVQQQKHANAHHSRYPYTAFFEYAWGISNYVDTVDKFGTIEEKDLEGGETQTVVVGQLLRYASKATLQKDKNLLLIRVGRLWEKRKYFFEVFDEKALDEVAVAGNTHIFCTSEKSDEYAKAEWIIKDDVVAGVRIECKAVCFENPTIKEVFFTQFPLTHTETKTLQTGGIVEKKPNGAYELPAPSYNVEKPIDLLSVEVPEARDDFPCVDKISGNRDVVLGVEDLKVNQDRCTYDGHDTFQFAASLLNAGSGDTYMFTKLKVEAKLLNDDEWNKVDVKNVEFGYGKPFPLTLGPMQTAQFEGFVKVPYFGEAKGKKRADFYVSHLAKYTPLRLRFSAVDVKERIVSRVVEFTQKLRIRDAAPEPEEGKLWLFVDNPLSTSRQVLKMEMRDKNDLTYGDMSLRVDEARAAVHAANKSGNFEVLLEAKTRDQDAYCKKYFAMVDRNCQAVYAVKCQLIDKKTGHAAQGFVPVRFYGEEDAETADIAPAEEKEPLPATVQPIGPLEELFKFNDQGKDEVEIEAPSGNSNNNKGGSSGGGGGGGSVDLSSLEDKLDRIATALEALVALQLTKK